MLSEVMSWTERSALEPAADQDGSVKRLETKQREERPTGEHLLDLDADSFSTDALAKRPGNVGRSDGLNDVLVELEA